MKRFTLSVCLLLLFTGALQAQNMRQATKIALGETTHITLDKGEQQDFALRLATGSYYIVCDLACVDEKPNAIIGKVQLLKSNGVMVKDGLLRIAEMGPVVRVGNKFTVAKPFASRLRVLNEDEPVDIWLTVIPAKQMKFIPFGFKNADLKLLGIGADNGKGGQLQHNEYAFHSITLKPGKYDISLYFKQLGNKSDSLIGSLERYDAFGFRVPLWKVNIGSVGYEERKENRLILTKQQTVIFKVINTDNPAEYTVGIEKAND